jgi:acyl carrier protein
MELAGKRFNVASAELNAADDFFEKLGIDSVQALDLLTDVEKEFDVEIPDYALQGVKTFSALATEIEKRR